MIKTHIQILLCLCFLYGVSYRSKAQNDRVRLDSIYKKYLEEKNDTSKARFLTQISWLLYIKFPDSAFSMNDRAISIAENHKACILVADGYRNKGAMLKNLGRADEAEKNLRKSLEVSSACGYNYGAVNGSYNLAVILKRKGKHDESIKLLISCIELAQAMDWQPIITDCYNNIANNYIAMGERDKAFEYYEKALKHIRDKKIGVFPEADILGNIAAAHFNNRNFKVAKEYLGEAKKILSTSQDPHRIIWLKKMMSCIYIEEQRPEDAKRELLEAIELSEKNGGLGIGELYANLGVVYLQMAEKDHKNKTLFTQAIQTIEKGLELGKKEKNTENIQNAYDMLVQAYEIFQEYKTALYYKNISVRFGDSVVGMKMREQSQASEEKFQTSQKQKEIEILTKDNQLKDANIKAGKIVTIAISIGLILVLAFAVLSIRAYRQKKKANLELALKNDLIEKQKAIVEEKQKEVLDSIKYAKRIQDAHIPSEKFVEKMLRRIKKEKA